MLRLLRLPTLLIVAIILAVAGYLIYRMVDAGKVQPLPVIVSILLAFLLIRVLLRMRRKEQADANDD